MKKSPVTKNVKVSIETLTLKPVLPLMISRPQTARRGRGFHPGGTKKGWVGKTNDNDSENKVAPSYNEATKSLVGLKEAQPKTGSICNLRSKGTTEKQEAPECAVTVENASTEEQNTRIICKLRSKETTEKQETKDSEVTQGNAYTKKGKCTGKLKLRRVKPSVKLKDEKDITQEEKLEDKTEQGAPNSQVSQTFKVQNPPINVSQMHMEVEALLSDDKAYEQCENRRHTQRYFGFAAK